MVFIAENRLKGKVAVVTAGSPGIGFGIATRLAQDGAKVIISSRNKENIDLAVKRLRDQGLTAEGVVCHVAKSADRERLFLEAKQIFGGIDILVSNVAIGAFGGVLDCTEKEWDKLFDVNVKASYLLAKCVRPYFAERGGGKIVFTASIGAYDPFELLGAYSVTKTALLGLTKAAALELVHENITVNCIAPGIVKTKFSAPVTSTKDAEEFALSKIPANRFGLVEDMGAAVAFLVSEDAKYITGETIIPSGGMISRL